MPVPRITTYPLPTSEQGPNSEAKLARRTRIRQIVYFGDPTQTTWNNVDRAHLPVNAAEYETAASKATFSRPRWPGLGFNNTVRHSAPTGPSQINSEGPLNECRSEPQIPHAVTHTRTSRGPSSGTSILSKVIAPGSWRAERRCSGPRLHQVRSMAIPVLHRTASEG
jgi:hypothetical protein